MSARDDEGGAAPSFLVVDDDEVFRERLARALRGRGFEVRAARGGDEAIARCAEDAPEVAVVDLRMPDQDGLAVLERIRAIDPTTRVILLTGYGSVPTAVEAMRKGAHHYLQKPVTVDELLAVCGLGGAPATTANAHADLSLARAEWEHIHRVLDDCEGNISLAARRLRIHRRSLQRKLQKHPPRS